MYSILVQGNYWQLPFTRYTIVEPQYRHWDTRQLFIMTAYWN